jgi:hypothetical protein
MSRFRNMYSISILPARNQGPATRNKLWENLAVASHEWGHHFMALNAHRLLGGVPKIGFFDAGVKSHVNFNSENNQASEEETNIVDVEKSISAVNEGIADLVAHYAFNSSRNEFGMIHMGSIKKGRDVLSTTADDNSEKILDVTFLKNFFSRTKVKRASFLSPDHQDVHAIGANLATSMDRYYELFINQTLPLQHKTDQKAIWLHNWLRAVNEKSFRESSPQGVLSEIIWQGVKQPMGKNMKINKKQCDFLAYAFPVFQIFWQTRYSCTLENGA